MSTPYIILTSSALLLFIVALFLYYRVKINNNFLSLELITKTREIEILTENKLSQIKENEFLRAKIELLEKTATDVSKVKYELQEQNKNLLLEVGAKLTKDLISSHKEETKNVLDLTQGALNQTSQKFQTDFERLMTILGSLNQEISNSKSSVDSIKNALLSPSGAGNLAEITLENILKSSGLRKMVDYIIQYQIINNENSRTRPDAVIFLPADNVMIVDAKASKFFLESEDNQDLMRTVHAHLKSLSAKEYGSSLYDHLTSEGREIKHIITLMFLPTEHAVERIIKADPNFMHKAWEMNVFPIGPSGLMNMLSFAKFQISEQLMIENHKKIIEEVQKIVASIGTMTQHSQKLGNAIQSVVSNYDKFAATFNSSFLTKITNIKSLGVDAKNKKSQNKSYNSCEKLTGYQLIANSELYSDEQAHITDENEKIEA